MNSLKRMLALLTTVLALGVTGQAEAQRGIFRIATASKAGTFYPIGSLIAEGISGNTDCAAGASCGVEGLIALAQVSNGSVANVEAISAGDIEAGLAQADVIYWAYSATERFREREPMTNLRAVANLYPGSLHVVTRAETSIERISDLRGKRVALDEPGSGTLATAELILSSVNLSKQDLSPLYIKHNHAGPMLASDQLDAFFFVAGFPTRSVIEASKSSRIRLLPLSRSIIDRLIAERPYFTAGSIPAGAYPGVDSDVSTVNIGTQLIVNEDLDDDLVYSITQALWSDHTRRLLDEGHPKGAQVQLTTALTGVAIPLHPGAARFYREAGFKLP